MVAMTHIAIHEGLHGKVVDWMDKISGADYGAPTRRRKEEIHAVQP